MKPPVRRLRYALPLVALVVVAAGGWYAATRGKAALGGEPVRASDEPAKAVRVEVVRPTAGGTPRVCVQPGTVEPAESADLYAKASGFLSFQSVYLGGGVLKPVDIGTRVNKGDILAMIAVPEYERQVQRDAARVKNATAKVKQMDAHLLAAKAEANAADGGVTLAKSLVKAKASYRQYREKQLARIKDLVAQRALEARLADEQEDFYLSALEAENAAKEGVVSAVERAAAARAKIEQAAADVEEAKAGVEVAEAEWEKSRVYLDYTVIRSPYTGVVTRRNFHVGEFVKSAEQGGTTPVLAVERTDVMRVVVRVPDRDVPFVSLGDPAVIEIDALPGAAFAPAGVARWSDAEDPQTRTMRTEIDVPNPDGRLRHGMYGRVRLTLTEGTPSAVRVPSAALSGKAADGRGTVRVVRGDRVHVVPVRFAADTGVEVEIVSGLTPADVVIVRATGPVEEGTVVAVGAATPPAATDH